MTPNQLFRLFSQCYGVECDGELLFPVWFDIGESAEDEQSVSCGHFYFKESDVENIVVGEYDIEVKVKDIKNSPIVFKFLQVQNFRNHI